MIIYNLRTPVETDAKICVGVTGENKSYTTKFLIKELTDKSLTFSIHMRFADGSVNTVVPDSVDVDETGTLIIWNVKKNDIFVHGFFDMQIEGRNSSGYVFQTEAIRMYADESIPIEDKEYEHPNSETIKLREEAYEFLCELKLQQDKFDRNMKQLLATDITKKQDIENLVNDERDITDPKINYPSISYLEGHYYDCEEIDGKLSDKADKTELTAGLKSKQNVHYLTDTVTTIDDFTACNQTNTVYTGRMQGFSTKFGESSDDTVKGFKMWFVLSGSDNPTWYRVILFDDGTIWTATRTSTRFTQVSYSKKQIDKLLAEKANTIDINTALASKANFADVNAAFARKADKSTTLAGYDIKDSYTKTEVDNLLADKADLDAYENVIFISNQISSAGVLNQFFADKNKMYVFTAIPPLSNDLNVTPTSQFELHNYENYQILRATGHPNKSDGNKTFIRVYNGAENKWDNVADCTLPDNYITKAKLSADLSAEISGKYDASNIETGSGEFTTTSARISSANFEYQKVGDYVTVNVFVSFAESSMGATTSIQLAGMPFTNESSGTLRLPCATSKKTGLIVALGKNTINILTSEAVTFSADETMGITITYKITKTNGG